MKRGWVLDLAALATSLAAFSLFAIRQLELPGLYYDEAADAVPAMQLVLGQKLELLRQTGLTWGGLTLPIMTMDYVGTVNTYLLVPLFWIFGVSVVSIRALTVLGAALTIVLSYFVAKELFDRPIAAVTVILLAVNPSFVFWSRQGIHVTSIMTVLSTSSLLCLLIWRHRPRPVLLFLAAFLLGLGLSAKLLFLWFIVALTISAFLLFAISRPTLRFGRTPRGRPLSQRTGFPGPAAGEPSEPGVRDRTYAAFGPPLHENGNSRWTGGDRPSATTEEPSGRQINIPPPLQLAGCAISFALGAWMIILYNVLTGGTVAVLTENLNTTSYGVNNFAFWTNLLTSLDSFRAFLRGENFWYLGGLFANDWYPVAFAVSAVGSLAVLLHPAARRSWRSLLFPLLMVALIVLQSSFTVSGLWATHDYITYPFPQLTLAAFAVTIARLLPAKKLTFALVAVVLISLVAKDSHVDQQYHRVLAKTGGLFTHSDATYRLAAYLDSRGVAEPMAMDWGIKTSVQILTKGRINPIEIFQYDKDPSPVFLDWLYGALTRRPDTLYIFHADGNEVFPRHEAFEDLARKLDKKVTLEQTVSRKHGAPLYTVYSAR